MGDQSIPAVIGGNDNCCLVERVDNATLRELGDLLENILFQRVNNQVSEHHLALSPDSVVTVFSLSACQAGPTRMHGGVQGFQETFQQHHHQVLPVEGTQERGEVQHLAGSYNFLGLDE